MSEYTKLYTPEARKIFKDVFRKISVVEQNEIFAEAAFPAYAHSNPLIDKLFWGRLGAVEKYVGDCPNEAVLDYGCGSGVMSWIIAHHAGRVIVTDIELVTLIRMQSEVVFPKNIEVLSMAEINAGGENLHLRTILALDVLEHVADLRSTLLLFKKLLKDGGEVIISGPTENFLYKIGRAVAGRRFTGNYHRTNISHIKNICCEFGSVTEIKKLYPFLPFFDVFTLQFK